MGSGRHHQKSSWPSHLKQAFGLVLEQVQASPGHVDPAGLRAPLEQLRRDGAHGEVRVAMAGQTLTGWQQHKKDSQIAFDVGGTDRCLQGSARFSSAIISPVTKRCPAHLKLLYKPLAFLTNSCHKC